MKALLLLMLIAAAGTLMLAMWSFFPLSSIWVERRFLDQTNHLPRDNEQAQALFDEGWKAVKEIGASWTRSDARSGWIYLVQASLFASGAIAMQRRRKAAESTLPQSLPAS